jgi:hypothetical protein
MGLTPADLVTAFPEAKFAPRHSAGEALMIEERFEPEGFRKLLP